MNVRMDVRIERVGLGGHGYSYTSTLCQVSICSRAELAWGMYMDAADTKYCWIWCGRVPGVSLSALALSALCQGE